MKRINRGIGARVEVYRVTVGINRIEQWKVIKNVKGVIVENEGYENYYHTCSVDYSYTTKHLIKNDYGQAYAIKLDNNITDIEGNNVIMVKDSVLKFLDRIDVKPKPITKQKYLNAKGIVKRYESENKVLK